MALKTTIPDSQAQLELVEKIPAASTTAITRKWPKVDAAAADSLISSDTSDSSVKVDHQSFAGVYQVGRMWYDQPDEDRSTTIHQSLSSGPVTADSVESALNCSDSVQTSYSWGTTLTNLPARPDTMPIGVGYRRPFVQFDARTGFVNSAIEKSTVRHRTRWSDTMTVTTRATATASGRSNADST